MKYLIIIAIVILAIKPVFGIARMITRKMFENTYGFKIGANVRIVPVGRKAHTYDLRWAYWTKSNKDRTADRRYGGNRIHTNDSFIYLPHMIVHSKNPIEIYNIVLGLRAHNVEIAYNKREIAEMAQRSVISQNAQRNGVYREICTRYSENGARNTALVSFLSTEARGVLPKGNLESADRKDSIALLITSPRHNYIVDVHSTKYKATLNSSQLARAYGKFGAEYDTSFDQLVYVTTAIAHDDAREFADRSGIELIDGNDLASYCNKTKIIDVQAPAIGQALTMGELLGYLPRDMYHMYRNTDMSYIPGHENFGRILMNTQRKF